MAKDKNGRPDFTLETQRVELARLFPADEDPAGEGCESECGDYLCTLTEGHGGYHAAHLAAGEAPILVWRPKP